MTGEPYTHPMAGGLAVRAYPDRRPCNLEIAGIHKALVLLRDGEELVEEGAGFGLPIVKYRDKTFFPGNATLAIVHGDPTVVVKTYLMDAVSIKTLGGARISDVVYHPLHRIFSFLYLHLDFLRPVFDSMIEMRNVAGVKTSFEPAKPRGEVEVKYSLHPDHIEVRAVARLRGDCEELIMLNEQGASTFRLFSDASDILVDDRMGAWGAVSGVEAMLSNLEGSLSFTVERPQGAQLWRGRESIRGRLSWAGLALSFKPHMDITYTVRVSRQPC